MHHSRLRELATVRFSGGREREHELPSASRVVRVGGSHPVDITPSALPFASTQAASEESL